VQFQAAWKLKAGRVRVQSQWSRRLVVRRRVRGVAWLFAAKYLLTVGIRDSWLKIGLVELRQPLPQSLAFSGIRCNPEALGIVD